MSDMSEANCNKKTENSIEVTLENPADQCIIYSGLTFAQKSPGLLERLLRDEELLDKQQSK